MTRGKFAALNALAGAEGIIAAAAMDQRGSLQNMIRQAGGSTLTPGQMAEFKSVVTAGLTPYASAILLDPEYSLPAIAHRAPGTGVLLAYEQWGYEHTVPGRLPALLAGWSVRRLVEAGATGIKILLYYDPDDVSAINGVKQAFIERVGAECRGNDVPFFLEPLVYSAAISDEKSLAFARLKPAKVRQAVGEFSRPRYGVDVLKVEVPVNMRYVAGARANPDGAAAYSRGEARQHFRDAAEAARLPFIYLSAAVSAPVFREALELAAEAQVPFSGVLCGRATWQDGVPAYVRGGAPALRAWVERVGVANIQALNAVLREGARPWWTIYGGLEAISVAPGPTAPLGA